MSVTKSETVEKRKQQQPFDHFFPYHLFTTGERIIIYGAGDIGQKFYQQAQEDDFVEVVAVLDGKADTIKRPFPVFLPEKIQELTYDSVLIAVNHPNVVASIRRTLRNLGVPASKIKCDFETYYCEHFYRNFYMPLLKLLGMQGMTYREILSKVEQKLLFSHRHIFPFHLFREGERIIIYGAGDIGQEFYREAQQEPFVRVLAVIDRNADNLTQLPMPVSHLEILDRFDYDSVLIAIHDEFVADEVREVLIKHGVPNEKIKWDGTRYYKDEFYQNYYFEMLRFLRGIETSRI